MMIYAMVFNSSQRKALQALVYFAGENIYPDFDSESDREYIRICDQCALKLLSNTLRIVGLIQISTGILTSFSMLAFIMNNEIQLSLPVLFPFTNLESLNGLIINIFNQIFIGFMGITGNIGIEIPTCIIKNAVLVIRATICYSIDELSEKIEQSEGYSKACIDIHFRNILIQAQDLDRLV